MVYSPSDALMYCCLGQIKASKSCNGDSTILRRMYAKTSEVSLCVKYGRHDCHAKNIARLFSSPWLLAKAMAKIPELKNADMPNYDLFEYEAPIDSANMTPDHWMQIGDHILKKLRCIRWICYFAWYRYHGLYSISPIVYARKFRQASYFNRLAIAVV